MSSREVLFAPLLLAACMTFGCASSGATMSSPPTRAVEPGDRVRVTLATRIARGPMIGVAHVVAPDSIVVVREEGGLRTLKASQVERLEVSGGKRRTVRQSSGELLLASLPLTVPLVLVAFAFESEGLAVVALAAPLVAGAVLGGSPKDDWTPASWPVGSAMASDPATSNP